MKYASVCSGVEAASLAWIPLGWEAVWFSEIEPFPCAVLKERFPNVPNLGDMTKINVETRENGDQIFTNGNGAAVTVPGGVELLVGGTPCQSFSVAGKREGLEGASGLAKSFIELLGAMRPRWFVWENVPGCLSAKNKRTGTYDFNFLLAAFADCGYSLCWRILDAQYVRVDGYPRAVPQRRRRVFVVGHLGADWQYPASVLFEPDSLFGDTPPRRTKGQAAAAGAEGGADTAESIRMRAGKPGGGKGTLVSHELSLTLATGNDQTIVTFPKEARWWDGGDKAGTLRAEGENRPSRPSNIVCNAGSFMGGQGSKAGGIGYSEETAPTIKASQSGSNQAPDIVLSLAAAQGGELGSIGENVSQTLTRNNGGFSYIAEMKSKEAEKGVCVSKQKKPEGRFWNGEDVAGTLTVTSDRQLMPDKGRLQCVIEPREDSVECLDTLQVDVHDTDLAPTLLATDYKGGKAICYENHGQDSRISELKKGVAPQLNAQAGTGGNNLPLVQECHAVAIAENIIGRQVHNGGNGTGAQEEIAYTQNATGVMGVANFGLVRRLLPVETERLMGFPDNWTRIPWRGKPAEDCPDGPRYKACGNSMCVNVMRWIGMRIEIAERKKR